MASLKDALRSAVTPAPAAVSMQLEEDFDCAAVEAVRVRFGPPGFVDGTLVGLFVEFRGIPAGSAILRVWWDYDGRPEIFQDLDIVESSRRREDGLSDFDDVLEHQYPDLGRFVEYKVRVELILEDRTGNCARNRMVGIGSGSTRHVQTLTARMSLATPFTLYRDVYRIVAPPGTTLSIRIDTVSAATTFDPAYVLASTQPPAGFLGTFFALQDDDFACTFPPPSFSCPTGSFVLPADLDGVYYLSVLALFDRAGTLGEYVLRVSSSVPIPPLDLVENDGTWF